MGLGLGGAACGLLLRMDMHEALARFLALGLSTPEHIQKYIGN